MADFDGLCCWPAISFNSSILGNSSTFVFGVRSVGSYVGQWCVLMRAQNLGHNSGGHWLVTCAVLYLCDVDPVAVILLIDGGSMEQQVAGRCSSATSIMWYALGNLWAWACARLGTTTLVYSQPLVC
jgi:hypothetical protein